MLGPRSRSSPLALEVGSGAETDGRYHGLQGLVETGRSELPSPW